MGRNRESEMILSDPSGSRFSSMHIWKASKKKPSVKNFRDFVPCTTFTRTIFYYHFRSLAFPSDTLLSNVVGNPILNRGVLSFTHYPFPLNCVSMACRPYEAPDMRWGSGHVPPPPIAPCNTFSALYLRYNAPQPTLSPVAAQLDAQRR